MKGIVLAGGTGKRLWPITLATSKQLLPIYNKPLIYYPISTLMQSGIREILIITNPIDQKSFRMLLGDGSAFGVRFTYQVQEKPEGIAQAFIIAEDFIAGDQVALILGDNLFHGTDLEEILPRKLTNKGARIYTYQVSNPVAYGVLNLDRNQNPVKVEEKPKNPTSNLAITGLYFFDNKVIEFAKIISPSRRGELEITEIMQLYINEKQLEFIQLSSRVTWLDTGTPNSLSDASQFVRVLEERTGKKIACLEEIAFLKGWLEAKDLIERIRYYGDNDYGRYLNSIFKYFQNQ
jgi:glucose-1-phosphate thymidylyltransferase